MKKILIITYSFPPLNNIAARRFSELAIYFKDNGWDPYILTTNSVGDLNQIIPEEQVYRIGTHLQKGRVINRTSSKNKVLNYLLGLKRKFGFNSRLYDSTQKSWYKSVLKMDLNVIKNHEFDLIIASYRPGSALRIGNYLSNELQVPLICDFRDLGAHFSDKYEKRNFIFKTFDKIYEKKLIKNAIGITTVSSAIRKELLDRYKKPTEVIYNGWYRNDPHNMKNGKNSIKSIYYAGSFYEHRFDSLILLLKAIHDVEVKLIIRSLGPEDYNIRIKEKIKDLNLKNKVLILPPSSPEIIYKESNEVSFNLILEDLDTSINWKKGNLTGKFLSLLTVEPRIIAIARNDSEIGEILKSTEKGDIFSNSGDINRFFKEDYTFKKPNNDEIAKYSKENQAKKLLKFCEGVIQNNKEE